jgi:hypothetical protein
MDREPADRARAERRLRQQARPGEPPRAELTDLRRATGHHLTSWAAKATVVTAADVTYHAGDVVTYGDAPDIYRCTTDGAAGPPPAHAEGWTKLPAPSDDVRATGDAADRGVP